MHLHPNWFNYYSCPMYKFQSWYCRLQLRHHHLASMLGSLEFVLVGLWSQRNFCFQMDFLSQRTSTELFVLALMVHPISPKLVVWPAFHLKASRWVYFSFLEQLVNVVKATKKVMWKIYFFSFLQGPRIRTVCHSEFQHLKFMHLKNLQAVHEVIGFYKENTDIIVETFNSLGFKVYGGKNAPYVWVQFPGRSSWDVFSEILEKTHVVTTPGSGFGPGGEGFIRVSAFGHRGNVLEACKRFKHLYKWLLHLADSSTFLDLILNAKLLLVPISFGTRQFKCLTRC